MRKEFELKLLIISQGRMIGDYGCLHNGIYQQSVICESPTAQVLCIKIEDLLRLETINADNWRDFIMLSNKQQDNILKIYYEKLKYALELKSVSANNDNKADIKKMCGSLMREMLWSKPPTTIEMFTLKKHM